MRATASFADLLALLRGPGNVFIQTHDFPDHDSVASAFGLQRLLQSQGVDSAITFEGEVQRESLTAMTQTLGIELHHNGYYQIGPADKTVVVDGCVGNRNVSHLLAREVGVIDHHMIDHPDAVPYVDIRPGVGACCTIVYDYYRAMKVPVPGEVATALLIGIMMDTRNLLRSASNRDVAAYTYLRRRANMKLVMAVAGGAIQDRDLLHYRIALENIVIHDRFAFCYLPEGCTRNLLGILADFFMGLRDVDVVALCAAEAGRMNLSVRCERDVWNASSLVRDVLRDIGMGGGHRHMAGGSVYDGAVAGADDIYRRFCSVLGIPARTAGNDSSPNLSLHIA